MSDGVVDGFLRWYGAAELVSCTRPAVGFSSETYVVEVRLDGAAEVERVVLKLPPAGAGIFPRYDFAQQAAVQGAMAAAGIPAPAPATAVDDRRWLGAPFLVMPAVAGHIVDEVPVRDRWLRGRDADRNAAVQGAYLDVLADIHRVEWRDGVLGAVLPARDNGAELEHWRAYLGWYGDGAVLVPALVDALDWCEANRPPDEPEPSVLWGDVRLGNVVLDDDGRLVAVLDWEMASIGAAEHDLAWALTLESVQAELFGRTVPGFLDHDAAVARYEARLGRSVGSLPWYEVFALLRSTAIMTRIAHLQEAAGSAPVVPIAANPILDVLARRIASAAGAGRP